MPDYGTIINGAQRSDSINQDSLVIDMEKNTALLDPDSWIFRALVRAFGPEASCMRRDHKYRERRLIPNFTSVSTAGAVGATSIYLADYDRVKNDFLLYVPDTQDLLLVQDASIGEDVNIVSALTGTGGLATAVTVGMKVVILGEAHAEGEDIPTAYTNDSIDDYDYIEQMDRVVQATDVEEAEEHSDATEKLAQDRRLAMIEYEQFIDLKYYVGKRGRENTTGSGYRYFMGGVFEKFTENSINFGGSAGGFTLAGLSNVLGNTKYHGASSSTKIFLVGSLGYAAICSWPVNSLRISPRDKTWGVKLDSVLTGHGECMIGYDPVLSADRGLAGKGVLIDSKWIKSLYLQSLPVRMLTNIQNPQSIHSRIDAITGTFGLQVKFNELHAQMKGLA
jgi:hypothetical protein